MNNINKKIYDIIVLESHISNEIDNRNDRECHIS